MKSTLFLVAAIALTGCSSSESTPARIQSDAERFDNQVVLKPLRINIGPNNYTSVSVAASNYTDFPLFFLRCDVQGFLNNVLVAEHDDRLLLSNGSSSSTPDLDIGQTKSATLAFYDNPTMTQIDRAEWVCSYVNIGGNVPIIFQGGTQQ